MDHLLAMIARSQRPLNYVGELFDINGSRAFISPGIATFFCSFYKVLYSNKALYQDTALQHFMSSIMLPALSEDDQDLLDSPITLEELMACWGGFFSRNSWPL